MLKILLNFILLTTFFTLEIEAKSHKLTQKKRDFLAKMAPAVDGVYSELMRDYTLVQKILKERKNDVILNKFYKKYHTQNATELLKRMKPHPKAIALAQSALESGWGSSRFFREANNIFGVWSFNKDEPRVPALKKRGKKTVYVKKYSSLKESIKDYYKLMSTSSALKGFRDAKIKGVGVKSLVKELRNYSEERDLYVKKINSLIEYNGLESYK